MKRIGLLLFLSFFFTIKIKANAAQPGIYQAGGGGGFTLYFPDDLPNKTLYQIKRKGYTEFNDYLFLLKNKKADFLLLRMDCFIYAEKFKPYQTDSIGNFNGIVLYKLR